MNQDKRRASPSSNLTKAQIILPKEHKIVTSRLNIRTVNIPYGHSNYDRQILHKKWQHMTPPRILSVTVTAAMEKRYGGGTVETIQVFSNLFEPLPSLDNFTLGEYLVES